MRLRHLLAWLTAGLVLGPPGGAWAETPVDLDRVDRGLKREPTYAEMPRYCLLVFGPQAATKVWLVLDGETLYADLDADGDLGEEGERFAPQNRRDLKSLDGAYRDWEYQVGDVTPLGDGGRHTRFEIAVYRSGDEPLSHVLKLWVNDKVRQYAGWGPIFAPRREDAPIIHFGGPVLCRLLRSKSIDRRSKSPEIHFCFATPGKGKHSFAYIGYETVPQDQPPQLEIEWPAAGGKTVHTKATLPDRC
ncbi:MAG TPA: hypothetical protein VHC22_34175 [Pirellulales bacterium]|nr:hypothetical protein [Pirellulales bacterium]